MKAIIIAGGLGTRLRPLTYTLPKPIVPLVNLPFVEHQIRLLRSHGIEEIILNLHYFPEKIKELLGDGSALGVKIDYSLEEAPLGTAGAVKNAREFFDDEPLMVFNGDILTDINLSKVMAFHREKKSLVTLTLVEVEDPTSFGLVLIDGQGRIERFIEKPHWQEVVAKTINAGIYVIEPKVFENVPVGQPFSFERQLYPSLLAVGEPMYGYVSQSFWMDIGSPQKYLEAHHAILHEEVVACIPGQRTKEGVWWGEDCEVDKDAKVRGPSLIGNKCKIAAEAYIADAAVLGEGVVVGKKSRVENSVVWAGTKIGEGVTIKGAILGRDCVVEDAVHIGRGTVLADQSAVKKGTRLGD